MKQAVVDDWFESGASTVYRSGQSENSPVPMARLRGRKRIRRRVLEYRGSRRSVFDVWRVLLVIGLIAFAFPVMAVVGADAFLLQPDSFCVAESSTDADTALAGVLAHGWEGAIRLLLSLMFVALIAFRLWRDE